MMNKILYCLYTCDRDRHNLSTLKSTDWYKSTKDHPETVEILDVYADPSIGGPYTCAGNTLTVNTEESYDNLCIKTYKMLKSCYDLFIFDYLVKIDANIIANNHNRTSHLFSFEYFLEKLQKEGIIGEYNGLTPIKPNTISTFRNWASMKKIFVMPEALISDIGEGKWPKQYWAGGCYCLGKKSVEKVLKQKDLFDKFKNLMGGCEDMAVACALK
jgi:hypothetical protein